METLINYRIPPSRFELVRDEVSLILMSEITNQLTLTSNNLELGVFVERTVPIDDSEQATINISLSSDDFSNKDQLGVDGNLILFIDVYTQQNDSPFVNQMLLNYVRHILSSQYYNTLGFDYGFVSSTLVEGFELKTDLIGGDSNYIKISRLKFSVRVRETQEGADGILLKSNITNFKLCPTNLGYKVISNF